MLKNIIQLIYKIIPSIQNSLLPKSQSIYVELFHILPKKSPIIPPKYSPTNNPPKKHFPPTNPIHLPHEDIRSSREVFSGRSLIKKAETEKGASLTTNSFSLLSSLTLLSKNGGYLLSHFYAVPSTWLGLTSLFGMGRGGSPTL